MQFTINRKFVVNYLLMSGNSSQGATVTDIMAATGLGRATIYRVIQKTKAIKRVEAAGKLAQYYVDPDEWHEEEGRKQATKTGRVKNDPEGWRIPVEPQLAKYIAVMPVTEFVERARQYRESGHQDEDKTALIAAIENAVGYQNGTDTLDPELMRRARIAIERMENFHVFMYLWLLSRRQHKEYLSDENWWTLFVKD